MIEAPENTGPAGLLELCGVSLTLDGARLFEALNAAVPAGDVVTIMGPSGCGKSSLLAFICGTLAPAFGATGEVRLDGGSLDGLPPEQRHVGILFQDDLLFPHMSVGENLSFGLPPSVTGRAERRARVEAALVEAGLQGMADRDPDTLSGGQRGRVAVMRTLLSQPRALLLDEPFAKLDVDLRARFRTFVFAHARDNKIPTLLVTHDPSDAEAAAGPVIELI